MDYWLLVANPLVWLFVALLATNAVLTVLDLTGRGDTANAVRSRLAPFLDYLRLGHAPDRAR